MKVFKFGGASIVDAQGVRNVAEIIRRNATESMCIVISAMGKTTNALEEIVHAYFYQTGKAPQLLEYLKQKHKSRNTSLKESLSYSCSIVSRP